MAQISDTRVGRIKLLIVDTNVLNSAALRSHLAPEFNDAVELIFVQSLNELERSTAAGPDADGVLLVAWSDDRSATDYVKFLATSLPSAMIILVTGVQSDSTDMTGIDPARVWPLPVHQLARLPFMLKRRETRETRHMHAFPEIPAPDAFQKDIYQVIAGITADYVYTGLISEDGSVEVTYRGDSLVQLSGYSHEEIDAGGSELLVHPDDRHIIPTRRGALKRGETRIDEFRLLTKDGQVRWIRDYARRVEPAEEGSSVLVVGAAQDITNEKLLQSRLTVQASILEMIARGKSRDTVLNALNTIIEEQIPDAISSIQLIDQEARVLRPKFAENLPSGFADAIGEIPVDPDHGACGNAAFHKELTISINFDADPRFERYMSVMARYGLAAVWATPIFDSIGDVAGTYALYFPESRAPIDHEIALMESAAQIAGIALDVDNREVERHLAQTRYRTLVEQVPAITLMADASDPCWLTYLSPQFEQFSEIPGQKFLHDPGRVRSFVHPEDRPAFDQAVEQSRDNGTPMDIEFRIRRGNGAIAWIQASISLVRDHTGKPLHWLGVMLDVTDRNEAIRQKALSDRRYQSLFDENLNIIVIYDYEGRVIDINPAAVRLSGYTRDEVIGGPLLWVIAPEDRDRAERYFLQARAGVSCQFTVTIITKQGERVELSASQSPVVIDGEIVGVSSVAEDVTDRRQLESQLHFQAYHDALTGLPNRMYFDRMLKRSMDLLGRNEELSVMFMDLNNFKVINDSLGHDVGDRYLRAIAEVLRQVASEDAVVARFGGDEFTVLLPASADATERAVGLAEAIMTALRSPIAIDGYELGTNVSVGIASTTLDTMCQPRELIRRADIALFDAKRGGGDSDYRIFDESMDEWVLERLWVEGDLRQALDNGEFVVHFQPIMDVQTGEPIVVEALLRWNHPERGLLRPDRFLRIAEETGHIIDIDKWVLRTACQQVADWNDENPDRTPLYVGVNISTRQFWSVDLAGQVKAILDDTGLDPALLCIEITESTMMRDASHAVNVVRELRQHGVLFAIDDFGTGYSSLSYLREFPIDVLKIDRAFISSLDQNEQQPKLVEAIVAMGRALNLVVVAEGVETEDQLRHITDLNCDLVQGYYFSGPLHFDAVNAFLDQPRIQGPGQQTIPDFADD